MAVGKRPSSRRALSPAEIDKRVERYAREVGHRIEFERQEAGLTQEDLARLSGLSVRTIIEVESGAGALLSTVARLCYALRLAPEEAGAPAAHMGEMARVAMMHLDLDPWPTGKRKK